MAIGNQIRTVILLGLLTGLLLWVGGLVGGPTGLTFALVFAIVMNFGAYWFSDKLVLAILTPLLAMIIQMAISRSREFIADESAAKTIHSGLGLASALEKLETSTKRVSLRPTSTTQTTAHLFITNPFRGKGFFHLFTTHPPIKERVKRLRLMNV